MICPWKKRTERYADGYQGEVSKEWFCDCDEDECPFYSPMQEVGGLIIQEQCKRVKATVLRYDE